MSKRLALYGLLVASLAGLAVLVSCSGGSTSSGNNNTPPTSTGSLVVFTGDQPVCDVESFTVTVSGATMTPAGGGSPVSVLSSSSPVTLDFACLMDFSVPLSFTNVPTGTYDNITLTLTSPQLVVLQGSPLAPTSIPTTLTSSTATAPINPGLLVSNNGVAGLDVDFELQKSVQSSNGQATGSVTPTLRVTPATPTRQWGMGEVEQLSGVVQSVSTTSNNSAYTGSFVIQTDQGTTFTIYTNSQTRFNSWSGVTSLSDLAVNTYVAVDAIVDTSGNIVALGIAVETQENQNQYISGFEGLVTSVTTNGSGAVTQFNLFVRGEIPDESGLVPRLSVLTVNVSNTTWFGIEAFMRNEWGMQFGATNVNVGQEITVQGQLQTGPPVTLSANAVLLREQSVLGNFTALVGSNNNAFTFTPCNAIFNGQSITAVVFGDSMWMSVSGLSGLTAGTNILVKGLLLYEPTAVTGQGGQSVGPGWVMEAREVHQLNSQ